MSGERSPSTEKPYGVKAVCSTLDVPRSTFYERKRRKHARGRKAKKRGPKPTISDEKLLVLIREDLASSPFVGEGHRKVWARLKFGRGVKVSRKRVLRLMRENNLLSPYRRPQMPPNEHDGEIITHAPNIMWGPTERRSLPGSRAGVGYSWRSSTGTQSAWDTTSPRRATASPRASQSPWAS